MADNYCEGMIRINAFRDDYYTFDSKNYCIEGESLGASTSWHPMTIRVKNVDLERKQIDFEPYYGE